MSTRVSDNFARANGALGANWATPVPNQMDFTGWAGTPAGNVLISGNGVGADATNGLDCCALWNGGQFFDNNQWAAATVKTVAANTATLAITAAVQAAGNTTYTYTVTQGDPSVVIGGGALFVVITGMADNGNNGFFTATTFGAGTFTVANASGVTRAGQSGVGNCPSDNGAGVVIRGSGTSAATLNGYVFQVGTNSFGGFGETYYYELWKVVNGAGTVLMSAGAGLALSNRAVVAGDTIGITVIGTTVTAYLNGIILTGGQSSYGTGGVFQVTDTSIQTGGVPGLWTFAVSGAKEYVWSTWSSGSVQHGGNNGTTINNFNAGDMSTVTTELATETFKETGTFGAHDLVPYADGDLHAANANWVYEGASTFAISSGVVRAGAGQNPSFAYRSDISAPTNDQWAEEIFTVSGAVSNSGPAVRIASGAQTAYITQCRSTLLRLTKYVAGTPTSLGDAASPSVATGDSIRITVRGTTLNVYKNGLLVIGPVTDNAIASGNVGIFCTASATDTGFSKWAGGSLTELTAATNFVSDAVEAVGLDATNGGFCAIPDASSATGKAQALENTITWPPNQYCECVVTATTPVTDNGGYLGPQVRASFSNNGYALIPTIHTTVSLYRFANAAATLLATYTHTTIATDVLRVEVQGEYLVSKINGSVVGVFMDNAAGSIATGKPGAIWSPGTVFGGSGLKPLQTLTTWKAGSFGLVTISGSAGVAGATVSYSGQASGSVVADGSGNYSIPGLANGSYTITPSLTGYTFSPINSAQTAAGLDITGVNFTAASTAAATGSPGFGINNGIVQRISIGVNN